MPILLGSWCVKYVWSTSKLGWSKQKPLTSHLLNLKPWDHKGPLTNPTMHQSHIQQCTILWQKWAHVCPFLSQNGASWDICPMHYGICEMGLQWRLCGWHLTPGSPISNLLVTHLSASGASESIRIRMQAMWLTHWGLNIFAEILLAF